IRKEREGLETRSYGCAAVLCCYVNAYWLSTYFVFALVAMLPPPAPSAISGFSLYFCPLFFLCVKLVLNASNHKGFSFLGESGEVKRIAKGWNI
ncbi:MAG: hypothetical protein ACRDBM_13060, partial [Sporomusa sp.]